MHAPVIPKNRVSLSLFPRQSPRPLRTEMHLIGRGGDWEHQMDIRPRWRRRRRTDGRTWNRHIILLYVLQLGRLVLQPPQFRSVDAVVPSVCWPLMQEIHQVRPVSVVYANKLIPQRREKQHLAVQVTKICISALNDVDGWRCTTCICIVSCLVVKTSLVKESST